jgi:hypothetical protein
VWTADCVDRAAFFLKTENSMPTPAWSVAVPDL